MPLTIFWRAREPLNEDFSVYVRLFDAEDKIITRWDAFPGRGLYPTRVWQPGEIVTDEYCLPIPLDARAGVGRIEVGLFRRVPLETLTARDPRGNIVTPTLARFKIIGRAPAAPHIENAVEYAFGNQIALIGYARQTEIARGATFTLKLYWRALASISEDYTVFVHLVDAGGAIRAQEDQIPGAGAYPTTSWVKGEYLVDVYDLALPRGAPLDGQPAGLEFELTGTLANGAWTLRLLKHGEPAAGATVEVFLAGAAKAVEAGKTDAGGRLVYRPAAAAGAALFSVALRDPAPEGAAYDFVNYETSLAVSW